VEPPVRADHGPDFGGPQGVTKIPNQNPLLNIVEHENYSVRYRSVYTGQVSFGTHALVDGD
jgi:hypothetical protein